MLIKVIDQTIKKDPKPIIRVYNEFNHSEFQYYNPDEIVVYHHNDSDGKLAAQLVYETFKIQNTKRFVQCDYGSNMPTGNEVTENDVVFIVDYCIPFEQLVPIVEIAKKVFFMDHHKSAIKMMGLHLDYFEDQSIQDKMVIDIDMTRCGGKIVSDFLYQHGTLWDKEIVNSIDKYDRWTRDIYSGNCLNKYLFNSTQSYVGSEAWYSLLHDLDYATKAYEIGAKFDDLDIMKNKLVSSSFSKEREFHGLKIMVIEGYGNSQLFGENIHKYDACCIFHRLSNGKWQHSLYTDNKELDLTPIAESYGGGGHPNACGWTTSTKLF